MPHRLSLGPDALKTVIESVRLLIDRKTLSEQLVRLLTKDRSNGMCARLSVSTQCMLIDTALQAVLLFAK